MNKSQIALAGYCDPKLIHRMAPAICIHTEYLQYYGRPANIDEFHTVLKWHCGDRWY